MENNYLYSCEAINKIGSKGFDFKQIVSSFSLKKQNKLIIAMENFHLLSPLSKLAVFCEI